ncbi:LysR family transcriptional regulator [Massilia sp. CF038]|uniref:LysR family transcriptional regulator n=1 Tax=Massilia sp. CF038 TaxID=1881045 RepID=UPI000919546F|nr:LysR family transcriptional regulator [Massilia sp. CF038]SHH67583.1 transcriptional regulator, LysR family [Massilia sp. CF038]
MDQLKAMQIFRAVAECKSFAQAAELLDLPRPTVTNAVQSVEQHLGVRLLQRTTRKVSLTMEGEIYLARCIRLLTELEDMDGLFAGPGPGTIRADMPERLARTQILPRLPEFLRLYPGMKVRIGSRDRFVDLVGEGIDCAIRVGKLRDSSLIARPLGALEQINLASPAYLQQHGTPDTPADLDQHMAVNFFSSQTGRDLDWEYVEDGKEHRVPMRSVVSVSSTEAYTGACLAGLGMIQAPRLGVEDALASGALVEVLPAWRAPPLPVAIVYSHNRHLSPRVRAFVDWVASVLVVH